MSQPLELQDEADLGFAPPAVEVSYLADGSLLLRSPLAVGEYRRHICEYLAHWAAEAPNRTFLAERDAAGEWRRINYADAWRCARGLAQAMIDRGHGQAHPIAVLTGNSIEHALITFGGMLAGTPVAPISPAYSAHPDGVRRLAEIAETLRPAMVFAQAAAPLAQLRTLAGFANAEWISVAPDPTATAFSALAAVEATAEVDAVFASSGPDDIGKILFTSGSTGTPKGVPQTQRMLCCCIHTASLLVRSSEAPVIVDWMPWHHTMGGNNTLHGTLREGGTLYIDDGRPTPQLFGRTLRNLKEISVTSCQNVPAGLQMLVDAMETDDELRRSFFHRIERVMYAGAALPRDIWERFQALAIAATGREIPLVSGYGTTETGPGISTTHWPAEGRGEIGLPFPGVEIKLLPFGDRYEIRVRGENVMPGYFRRPDLTEAAFDEDGFYRIGDAVKFADAADPRKGLRFAGRLSENFKLRNGSWVLTGELRGLVLAAAPSVSEVVIAGHDRGDVRVLVWATESARAELAGAGLNGPDLEGELQRRIAQELASHNQANSAATRRIAGFAILNQAPSLGAGEITDKGYVNQRAVLAAQADLIEDLYAPSPCARVVVL
ncbi:AMP-binding protein [Caulobacter sp. KR2-114]|jgi:feruloyl-CoA synthase|uniref:AMP-binding protein n=1 Tax=Caulobacter sp. KR2-114 TaxID=3400912 RepID=UPI003C026E8B